MTDSKPQTPTTQTPPAPRPTSQTGFRERKLEGGKKQPQAQPEPQTGKPADLPKEVGGPPGPEPTRYGDWAFKGRVTDF